MSDEEVRELLLKVKGITHWQIDMIVLFTLKRLNIFPSDDAQLKRIMTHVYELGASKTKAQMCNISELWSPNKSLAMWYIWTLKNKSR